jgi:CIC family chloride channel protein
MTRDFQTIPERLQLRHIWGIVARSSQDYFPVVDEAGVMRGGLTFQDLRTVLFEEGLNDLVVAQDLASPPSGWLMPEDTLTRAIDLLAQRDIQALPVMADGRVVGLVKHGDVVAAYNTTLLVRYGKGGDGE